MKILYAQEVSYSETEDGQEYFQVMFEGKRDGQAIYVLMQRAFEIPNGGEIYFESTDMGDTGYYVIKKAKLWRDQIKIELPRIGSTGWEIRFQLENERFAELEENLRAIFSKPNQISKE
jgi:hypothetical protein